MTDPQKSSERFYHPGLDMLRFFAFLMVYLSHAFALQAQATGDSPRFWPKLFFTAVHAGPYGVDLFFCLSSFLITALLLKEVQARGTIDVWSFYVRRILRIWPLYYVFLALSFLVFPRFLPHEHLESFYKIPFLGFFGNWICAWRGYPESLILPLWSVSLEEQFYFAWPLLLLVCHVKRMNRVVVGLLLVAFAVNVQLVLANAVHPALWCNTFVRLEPIAGGALLATFDARYRFNLVASKRALCFSGGLLLFLLVGWICPSADGPLSLLTYPLATIGSITMLISGMGQGERRLSFFSKMLIHLGRISFGLYVVHLLSLNLVDMHRWKISGALQTLSRAGAGLVLSILFAEASYHLLERPFLKLKGKFSYIDTGERSSRTLTPAILPATGGEKGAA